MAVLFILRDEHELLPPVQEHAPRCRGRSRPSTPCPAPGAFARQKAHPRPAAAQLRVAPRGPTPPCASSAPRSRAYPFERKTSPKIERERARIFAPNVASLRDAADASASATDASASVASAERFSDDASSSSSRPNNGRGNWAPRTRRGTRRVAPGGTAAALPHERADAVRVRLPDLARVPQRGQPPGRPSYRASNRPVETGVQRHRRARRGRILAGLSADRRLSLRRLARRHEVALVHGPGDDVRELYLAHEQIADGVGAALVGDRDLAAVPRGRTARRARRWRIAASAAETTVTIASSARPGRARWRLSAREACRARPPVGGGGGLRTPGDVVTSASHLLEFETPDASMTMARTCRRRELGDRDDQVGPERAAHASVRTDRPPAGGAHARFEPGSRPRSAPRRRSRPSRSCAPTSSQICLSSVVFPAPRKPERRVTGQGASRARHFGSEGTAAREAGRRGPGAAAETRGV